jgi:hypothetical protein
VFFDAGHERFHHIRIKECSGPMPQDVDRLAQCVLFLVRAV